MQEECLSHNMPEVTALGDAVAAALGSSIKDLPPIGGTKLDPPPAAIAESAPDTMPTSTFGGTVNAPDSTIKPKSENSSARQPLHAWASAAAAAAMIAALMVV